MMTMTTPLLITIPFSHYCEKARWALERAGVAFRESGHLPVLHVAPVRRAGGKRTVPLLVADGRAIGDSTDILQWADRKAPPGRRLYGDDGAERREIEALEDFFDNKLGPDTRRWAYFYVLPRRDLLLRLADRGVPRWESFLLPALLPFARAIMRRAMNITADGAQRSRDRIDVAFEKVAALLADGRPFLVGARPSAADLTFASLAAPVVAPPQYGAELPSPEDLPPEATERIRAWQQHPAGQFALRIYREHRR
jgi:glutathione S-transferase